MTRPIEDVRRVVALWNEGHSKRAISMSTGVPRATVRDWLRDVDKALARGRRRHGRGKNCSGGCRPWEELDERPYAYLLGAYLGDGCLAEHARAYRLRIFCDEKYPGIIEEIGASITQTLPNKVGAVQRVGCVEIGSFSQHWPCYFPQHGPGRKHERPIVLADWQRQIVERQPRPLLRGLIHSDGWRGMNVAIRHTDLAIEYRTYTRYQFTNRSADIRKIFCDACDLLGVRWTQMNRWTISVARRKDVHYLDSFIGPKR